jgi:capsule polysaccharide export protein KpsE/RkpR
MKPYYGIMGRLTQLNWIKDARQRRTILLILCALFALLALFPRPYKAVATLTPIDQSAGGLAPALQTVGAFAGFQQIIDVQLKVGRSIDVQREVIEKLGLADRWGMRDEAALLRKMEKAVKVRALRGSILSVETKGHDPKFATLLVSAYVDAMRSRFGELSRNQTAFKRKILQNRFADATRRLREAERRLNDFKLRNGIPDPDSALGAASARLPGLRDQLRDKLSELEVRRQFATDENYEMQVAQAEIEEIRRQIEIAKKSDVNSPTSVNWAVAKRTEYDDLDREVNYNQSLYNSYKRLIDGTALEDLVSTGSLRMLEEPHIDPDYQFNMLPALLFVLTLILAIAFEFRLFDPKWHVSAREEKEVNV